MPNWILEAPGAGYTAAAYEYDALGRQTLQRDFLENTTVGYERAIEYDTANRVWRETGITISVTVH